MRLQWINPLEGYRIIERNGKYGFLDENGNLVIPCKYDDYSHFDILACVKLNNKWGLIDCLGKECAPFIYDHISEFIEGKARVLRNGLWGFVNTSGSEFIPCVYEIVDFFKNGYAKVWSDRKCGIVDKEGYEIVKCKYYSVERILDRNIFITRQNNKYGISLPNNEVISCVFDEMNIINDLICVKTDGKWGAVHISMLENL